MKNRKKVVLIVLSILLISILFAGCREADRVNYNIKKEADYFNVTRRLTVINARSDSLVLEVVGNFSIKTNTANSELEITIETGENEYRVDYVFLNEWTIYTVEDISGANVSKYHYEINYLPEMVQPFEITSND